MCSASGNFLPSFMTKSLFSSLPEPKPDPLFAIAAEAQASGSEAINGTLGIYMDEEGKPLLFPSVKKALQELGKNLQGFNYSYPLLTGLPSFTGAVGKLLSPEKESIIASIASTGGTGALAINLRLLRMLLGDHSDGVVRASGNVPMIVPVPAWANHLPVVRWAGLTVVEAPYLTDCKASADGMIQAVSSLKSPFGILLQVGCHNPTGLDLSADEWKKIVKALTDKPCVALLDFAYQGFKSTPEEDAGILQDFLDAGITTLVTWSASKNHSIYGMRTGLSAAFVGSEAEKKTVEGTYCTIVRGLHSAAPTFGQAIVALVQQKYRQEWLEDLAAARSVMKTKRDLLLKNLPESFHAALSGYGMFAMLPLSVDQVQTLKTKYKVFLPLDGRVNIAGIPEKKIAELCEKITAVL